MSGMNDRLQRLTAILSRLATGKKHDPSWMRPMPLTREERRNDYYEAEAIIEELRKRSNAQISGGTPSDESDCSALRKRIADLEEGLRQIAVWKQEDQDDHKTCILQWRGCVAIARELLKPNAEAHGRRSRTVKPLVGTLNRDTQGERK